MRRDPVTPELREAVLERDQGCVGPRLGMPRACFGRLELDHIRASGGLGLRSASVITNLITVCGAHHYAKTVEGRKWRPAFIEWAREKESA